MRNLIRQPLTWMVAAEVIVVLVLMLVLWSLVASAASQRSPASLLPAVASPVDASAPPLPHPPLARPKAARQLPGLNLGPVFWRLRLDRLNREQVTFEQLEWRVVHAAMDALQRYLETVVLPSIVLAERA